jgi:hypothetical protein
MQNKYNANMQINGIDVIIKSLIHPNIKETLLNCINPNTSDWCGVYPYDAEYSFEYESDFMFGFIESLITRKVFTPPANYEVDDEYGKPNYGKFELQCYEWCVEYFAKYLPDLKFPITTETPYTLFTPDGTDDGKVLLKDLYKTDTKLGLTLDHNILNKIENLKPYERNE